MPPRGPTRPRRTKILATIGPASDSPRLLRALIDAGMDAARLNLAHGTVELSVERIARVRTAAADARREIGVVVDLPGPKVRAAGFPSDGAVLEDGAAVELVPAAPGAESTARRIAVGHATLLADLRPGDLVALGDGGVQLDVERVLDDHAVARVRSGGVLVGSPGVNLPPERLSAPTPTPEDLRLLEIACDARVDAVAISFVRSAEDVRVVRRAVGARDQMIVAKIETRSAVADIDGIIESADGVMVARGDLGVRMPIEEVPHLQKRIIRAGVAYGRPVITATQMLESMVHAPMPTRAEVSDVANAVVDGTSALMLSAETSIGRDPVAAVRTMSRIAERAERDFDYAAWGARLGRQETAAMVGASSAVRVTSAITAAGWRAALDSEAAAIICCTNTGYTARAIARFRPTAPMFAFTPSVSVARQLSLAWGIEAVATEEHASADEIVWFAVQATVERGVARPGDIVVVLVGSPGDPEPTTDVLRLVRIR